MVRPWDDPDPVSQVASQLPAQAEPASWKHSAHRCPESTGCDSAEPQRSQDGRDTDGWDDSDMVGGWGQGGGCGERKCGGLRLTGGDCGIAMVWVMG